MRLCRPRESASLLGEMNEVPEHRGTGLLCTARTPDHKWRLNTLELRSADKHGDHRFVRLEFMDVRGAASIHRPVGSLVCEN